MKRIAISLVVTGVLSFFAASCAKQTATVDDKALTTAIQSQLYANETTRKGSVAVAVKDGAVTLTGDVPSSDVELEAMKVANGVTGVRSVSDQMKVTTAAVPATPPPTDTTPAPAPAASNMASSKAPMEPAPKRQEARAEPAPMKEAKPARPTTVTIPAGTRLSVRTGDTIDSKTASEGQSYRASLDSPIISGGRVAVPAGSDVSLTILNVKSAGRIKGNSSLSLKPTALQYAGKSYEISSSEYQGSGKARGKNTALKTGIGAAAGALIGGLAGGGKGAGIGAAAGGGAGFGWNAFTHGDQVKIPAETVLNFQLQAPLTVPRTRGGEE